MADFVIASDVYFQKDGTPFQSRIPKDTILRLFPGSMLASVIEQNPDADNVVILNPEITPNVLQKLQQMAMTGQLPEVKSEYLPAANYFGIQQLNFIDNPQIIKFRSLFPNANLVDVDLK